MADGAGGSSSNEKIMRELRAMNQRIDKLEEKANEHTRLLYGDKTLDYRGLRQDVTDIKALVENMGDKQRQEAAEKRGMARLIKYSGITSAATLITLLILAWQSGIFGNGN